ncbi:DNA polymerase epsilon subunit 2 [Anabarilius grahami]|uniref:Leukocyte elastase inhibitor n=1 Tax=Anabarilius grahami TaxID=495550 RepID=A0A3N0YY96_ANAGA|nr:DNA polymerase epsilon subunit 2 [Anabarilius grahami]
MFTEADSARASLRREQRKMDARRVKLKLSAGFKMRGLILRPYVRLGYQTLVMFIRDVFTRFDDFLFCVFLSESSRFLLQVLESVSEADLDEVLERILDAVEKQPLSSSMIELSVAEAAVQDCSQSCDETMHELFTPPVIGSTPDEGRNKFQLKTVEALLGSTAKVGEVIVLGMISQLKEFHSGLYTESCFVLAEGWYEDSVFHVNAFGFPPTEPSSFTRAYYGNINFFGGPPTTAVKASAKLKQLEEENEDAMFVMVSDVWLDSVEVLEKIHTMFSGYSAMPPTCFIFCGNFSSAPYGRNQLRTLKDSFKALADLICEFPSIHNSSRFVFVPGPEDPGPGNVLPRPPLAEHITEEFRQRVPFSVFTTNPCRIQYCSQEMVVIREDLVNKMCRNCVRLPSSNLDIPSHFVKTILSQGHLTPLPLYVCPVYWAYDYALRIYPVPDVIVFADKYDPFNVSNTDCLCINPGSFPKSGFSFKVYYPSNRTVEDRRVSRERDREMCEMEHLSAAQTRFALSLFQKIRDGNASGNEFYSPLSISAALSMLSLGAGGNTASQMTRTLQFPEAEGEIHAGFTKLLSEMNKAGAPYALSLANRLYGEQSHRFVEKFLSDTKSLYQAELETVDFIGQADAARVDINSWVEKQTQEKIKDLLAKGDVNSLTKLVLVNAIYFKGNWERKFREEQTRDDQFKLNKSCDTLTRLRYVFIDGLQNESKPVRMMFQKAKFPLAFIPDVNCQILELPYVGKELSMLIMLPHAMEDDTTGLQKLESALTYENFMEWTRPDMMYLLEVEVSLPRFKMEETYNMNDLLISLGMVDAFDLQKADFSGMSPSKNLVLSKVVHKSFVEVNEEGTEAAAATGAVATNSLPKRFCANHPFLFFIRHNPSKSVLFYGRVCSP